uniref:Uncharacterized protein n=1 Tax=viral metagenome TaxID=1070528 RepID=A0A6C0CYK6_9ZZZZ
MANIILFWSSIHCGLIHFIMVYFYYDTIPLWYGCFLFMGVGSSIANHGMTSHRMKLVDRMLMAIGVVIDLQIIKKISNVLLWCLSFTGVFVALFLFLWSKLTNNVYFHRMSHFMITCTHCILVQQFAS